MRITWLGTASLLIEGDDRCLLIDPYLHRLNPSLPPLPEEAVRAADAILITHPHFDHLSDLGDILRIKTLPVYGCARCLINANRNGIEIANFNAIRPGDCLHFGTLTVRVLQGRHCHFDRPTVRAAVRRMVHTGRFGTHFALPRKHKRFGMDSKDIFVYEIIEGEKRMLIFGSAGLCETEVYPESVDLLVYPWQGRSDLYTYSLPILKKLNAKRVMLHHYDNAFPPLTETISTDAITSRKELHVFAPKPGTPIVL